MKKRTAAVAVAGFTLANLIWLAMTSSNYLGYVDSGELAAVCHTLGIAHPTGYPIYTLIGRVISILHPGTAIQAATSVSVIFGLGSGILFVYVINSVLKRCGIFRETDSRQLAVSTSMTVLLYGPIMWSLSVTNEVYTLHLFFVTAVILLVMNARDQTHGNLIRGAVLVSYLIGLSFAHHLSTFLLLPGLVYLVLAEKSVRVKALRLIPFLILPALLALTAYLYLPIRASLSPVLNWGDPSNVESLFRHVSGWQYQVWMFNKSLSEIIGSMADLIVMAIDQYPVFMVVPAIIGILVLAIKDRVTSVFITLVFICNLVYLAGYTIPEIDTYMLPLVMMYTIWCTIGIVAMIWYMFGKLASERIARVVPYVTALTLLAIGIYQVTANRTFADRSDYRYVETQTELLLDNLKPGAIFLTANWDFYSPLLYKKLVEGTRSDITAIDTELLRRSWYYDFILASDPDLFAKIEPGVKEFMPHVRLFEKREPFDRTKIENAYQSIINSIATIPDRPVYIDLGTSFRDIGMFTTIPQGPVFRLVRPDEDFEPGTFTRMTLGDIEPDLFAKDYSLKKQKRIIDQMNVEWKNFSEWYQNQNRVNPSN